MKSDFLVMLDACVLLPMPLADTMLRMAESPRLYVPRWSDEILAEVSRNLVVKFGKTGFQAKRREDVFRAHFPDATVAGYESLIPAMTNDPKDRHVLAACVASGAKLLVTYNHRHFPATACAPYGIERHGPSTFLGDLYDLEPGIVAQKLTEQAQNIGVSMEHLLKRLQGNVPGFVSMFCEAQKIELD